MTTVYSPAALLIIALSVLLVLVILLTVISFCVYVATGRSLCSFRKRVSRETPELFALQEMWRQSYWWINANWAVLNEMAQKGTLKSVVECRTEKTEDCLHWLRRPNEAKVEAFVTLQPQSRHFAATFAVVTKNGLIELTGVEKADGKYITIIDRAEAIRYAIEHAQEGDVIVLAGKGHEDYQEICGKKYHMDERELVADVVKDGNFLQ